MVESQLSMFGMTCVYVPEAVYVWLFAVHVYCSHSVTVVEEAEGCLIVRFSVTILSHPLAAPPVMVYVAVILFVLYVLPSIQTKGAHSERISVLVTGLHSGEILSVKQARSEVNNGMFPPLKSMFMLLVNVPFRYKSPVAL